jgi:hypothetical protein
METGILLLCICLGVGCLIVSSAYALRLTSETKIKEKAFERSFAEDRSHEAKTDELTHRLERFQNQRFGVPMMPQNDPRTAIAARIRAEEKNKTRG